MYNYKVKNGIHSFFFAYAVALQVCALLTGGGYGEKVVVPAGQLLPVMEGVSLTDSRQLARGGLHRLVHHFHASHLPLGESL